MSNVLNNRYLPLSSNKKADEPLKERYPKPPKGEAEILAFYGDPSLYADPDMYWKDHGLFAFVNAQAYSHIPTLRSHSGFWCHRKLKPLFEEIFQEIVTLGLAHEITSFDGVYNHRPIRGGTRLSMHAFGAAIDLCAKKYPLGSDKRMNPVVVECFTRRGFAYGGDFKGRKDPMHFQFGDY